MNLGLQQWAEATYQGCKDPTIGRDEEPELEQVTIICKMCEWGFTTIHDDKYCPECESKFIQLNKRNRNPLKLKLC